ncbi:unnamed protein product [Ectocarpus sp. 8 AP-2014]
MTLSFPHLCTQLIRVYSLYTIPSECNPYELIHRQSPLSLSPKYCLKDLPRYLATQVFRVSGQWYRRSPRPAPRRPTVLTIQRQPSPVRNSFAPSDTCLLSSTPTTPEKQSPPRFIYVSLCLPATIMWYRRGDTRFFKRLTTPNTHQPLHPCHD